VRRRIEKKLKGLLLERPENPPHRGHAHRGTQAHGPPVSVSLLSIPRQAAIRPEVIPVLDAIAIELAQFHRPIRIEGHTDNQTPARAR